MKIKNVAKRFGIASLCLATAISAFGGMVLSDNKVVLAEEAETIQTTDFVYTSSSAVAEMAQEMCTDPLDTSNTSGANTLTPISKEHTGLRMSSDEAYTATFKTIFKGNLRMKFRFPETYTNGLYGDFNFRIADATDDSKYFDITYYVVNEGDYTVAPCVQWGEEERMATHHVATSSAWYNKKIQGLKNHKFAPCFLTKSYYEGRSDRLGVLDFVWVGGVLTISANTTGLQDGNPKKVNMIPIASFDGTYDTSKEDNGFVSKTSWGLPKMQFKNGYTITVSSSFTDKRTTDQATDVFFVSIVTGGGTYDFRQSEIVKDNNMETFNESFEVLGQNEQMEGKFYLGWRNAETNSLYPDGALVPKGNYEPFGISYSALSGASLRIEDANYAESGIRFQTLFDKDEYKIIKEHLLEFGTLIARTDVLEEDVDFTFENYRGKKGFAKVKNTGGLYEYVDEEDNTYVSYAMAVVDINPENFTRSYSARGYLVLRYSDGSTLLIYTDFDKETNSGVIEDLALALQEQEELYNTYTDEQKFIIGVYTGDFVLPEDPDQTVDPDQTEE